MQWEALSNPRTALIAGGFVGVVCYIAAVLFKKTPFTAELLFEACVCGCLTAAGAHLLFCVLYPEHLVHFYDEKGSHVNHDGAKATLGESHIIDLLAGGFAATFLAGKGLLSICFRGTIKH